MADKKSLDTLKTEFQTIRDERRTAANTAERIGNAFLDILQHLQDGENYLRKDIDDTAQGIITFLKGLKIGDGGNNQITAEGLAQLYAFMTYNFQAGMYGTGAQIDHTGYAELDSLFVRKFISTPKFVFNEVAVTKAEQWNTNGFGTIESVDLETQQITLKLEENDYGSLAVGDICRGIFADIGNVYGSDKITEGTQDDCNFVQHRGFFTAYFYVKRIITSEQGKFVFEYGKKSESTPDPCAYMDFAQYGSFTDEQRRSSMYFCSRGRSYIEVLDGVDTWVIAPEHRVARYGWLGGLRIKKEDGTYRTLDGNGLFAQNNVYFGGTVEFLQGLSGLDDLIKQRESYDVSLSQYQSVLTVDDMGNVINGLYTEDEAKTMKQYRVSTAVFVRRGQEILLEEDDDVDDVTDGHYRLYAVSDDCEVKIQNSTIFVTAINNIKDGVAGTDDDADFDYDAMRQMTDAMVTIVVDLEGKTSKTVQMPIRIQHDSLPFMVCDLSNEHAGVAWNTKTGRYIGFPIETQVNLYYQNTPHEISDLTVSCPTGMTATVEETDGKITGKITITGDNLTEDTLEQVSEVRITAVGVYAGARYEYTKTLTVTKSADTVVYEVVPSVDSIVVDKNGGKSADTLTCAVYATSSDDKRYQLDALPTGFVLKYGLGDTATTAMALGETVTVGDTKQVTFALYDADGNILDREGVPVLAYGKDGKGIEYIYKRTKDNTKPDNPTPSDWETNADYQSQETEYIPTGWTDDPTGVDAVNVYEWVCVRTSTNGKWGTFSDPAEYAHFGKHAPSARCSDDIVTIPTDSEGNALEAFSETLTFDLLVDGRACTLTGVDKYSSTLSNVTCSISSYKATISCSNNAGLGKVAQTIVFAVTGTLDGASYTDYVTVKVLPNVTGADGDGYEYVYYLSSSATAPSAPSRTGGTLTSGWVDDPPALTDTKRYIYVAYKTGVIGGDGAFGTPRLWAYKAKDGADGVGITGVNTYYGLSTSSTSAPSSYAYDTMSSVVISDNGEKWLWSADKVTYTNGTTSYTNAYCVGQCKTLASITEQYGTSNSASSSPSTWSDTYPTNIGDGVYIWSRDKIVWKDGSVTNSSAQLIGRIGKDGDPGGKGDQGEKGEKGDQGEKGDPGKDGADETAYPSDMGVWDASRTYMWDNTKRDFVTYTDSSGATYKYFVKTKGDSFTSSTPPNEDTAHWVKSDTEYQTLVANTVFGENANIGGFMASNNRLVSSQIAYYVKYQGTYSSTTSYSYITTDDSGGKPVIDMVLYSSKYYIRANSGTESTSGKSPTNATYWRLANDYEHKITDAGNLVPIYKIELNGLDGIIRVLHPDGYRWEVQQDGIQMLGVDGGRHIEIDPGNKEIRLYNDDGSQSVTLDGRTETGLSTLFGTDGQKYFSVNSSGTVSYGSSTTIVDGTYTKELSTSVLQTESSGRVTISCTLTAKGSYTNTNSTTFDPAWYQVFNDGQTVPILPYTIRDGYYYWNNTVEANLYVYTYSDEECTVLIGQVLVGSIVGTGYGKSSKSISTTCVVKGGYHRLVLVHSVKVYKAASGATLSWSGLSAKFESDYYTSRVFANGLSFGSNEDNVLAAVRNSSGNMEMRMATRNGAHGINIDPLKGVLLTRYGIQGRTFPTVMIVNVAWNSKTEYSRSYWTCDSSIPTLSVVTGSGEGMMRITCSLINTLKMSFDNCLFSVNTYGGSRGGINGHVRSVNYSNSYIQVECSDDTTDNYCSFVLEVRYTGGYADSLT